MKMVGATLVGLVLWTIVMFVFSIIGFAGIMASEGMTDVEDGSILRITLNGEVTERDESSPLAILGGDNETLALEQLLEAIDKAGKSDKVKGIYLEGGALAASPAMLQELRQALVKFKETNKWIVAYGDTYTQGSYYICSVADELYINPQGMLDWHGMAAQPMFYTEVMKKLGVKMQVFKVGTFKSAVEPFINTEMSEPNRQQVTSYLTSIWGNMVSEVAKSRKLTPEKLNAMADTLLVFQSTDYLLKEKMVDKAKYKDEIRDLLKKKCDLDEDETLTFVSVNEMANSEVSLEKKDDCIAVLYAYGDIVDDAANNMTRGMAGTIAPAPINKELDKLMNDDDVKAVVIRVNSGGGSAYASEQIWRHVTLLKKKKPVVVSMGGMAASGGYYISCNASKIVAEPTTLTGSIGIFGMIPDMSELLTEKIGLRYDVVKTNAHSDFGAQDRPFTPEEGRLVQAHIERGYDLFTRRVAEGRNISQDSVKVIAEGRVWTGEQAKKIGLVDELGNLETAIKAAAKLAKTKDYVIAKYPESSSFFEKLMSENNDEGFMESQLKSTLGEYYGTFNTIRNMKNLKGQGMIQARMPYELIIR